MLSWMNSWIQPTQQLHQPRMGCPTQPYPRRIINLNVHRYIKGDHGKVSKIIVCDHCDQCIRVDDPLWHCRQCVERYDLCDECYQERSKDISLHYNHPHDDFQKL